MRLKYDVVVLGAGASGLGAAKGALGENASVILIERDPFTGGVLNQCIHTGFGLQVFRQDLTGPEFHELYINSFPRQFDVLLDTTVLEIDFANKELYAVNTKGTYEISFKSLVLATGARERPFEALRVPGTRPSGIFTAGLAQKLVNIENVKPGTRAAIIGSGDIGMIMARRLVLEGVEVEGVYEIMPFPGGLARNIYQCLYDYGIPLHLSTSVIKVHGNSRLEGVTVAQFENGKLVEGTERLVALDTLIVSIGLIPENDLVKSSIELSKDGGAIVDDLMRTSIPFVFACGNNTIIHDLVDFVAVEGELAGRNAALLAKGQSLPERKARITYKDGVRIGSLHWSTLEESFTLYLRVTKPMRRCSVQINGEVKKHVINAKPSEMIELRIDPKKERLSGDIEISVIEKEET